MKIEPLVAAVVALVGAEALAQLRITTFNSAGELSWTNSVTNATCAVQWASSPAGPWSPFDKLTNLNSIRATSNRITIQVPPTDEPRFYRVRWSDAPPYAGLYDVREYDTNGNLVVTGWLWLAGEHGSPRVQGTRALGQVGGPTNYLGPQLGTGTIYGGFSASFADLWITLTPNFIDNDVYLHGFLVGNVYQGRWAWNTGGLSPIHPGTFTAVRKNADSPPLPNALGTWVYRTYYDLYFSHATGQLAFATSTNPLAGSWAFANDSPTTHLLGQGDITNATLLGNNLRISIGTDTDTFVLDGEMAGDFYAGFFYWASNEFAKGVFMAKRAPPP